MEEEKKESKKVDKIRSFGRGWKLTFMSNDIQNKLIDVISKEVALEIANWAVSHDFWRHTQYFKTWTIKLACLRVGSKSGNVSENLLFYTRALSTTTEQLLNHIND